MKRISLFLIAALAVGACSKDLTAPLDTSATLDEAADLAFSASFVADAGNLFIADVLRHLPANLKLTSAQEASIKALLDAFGPATKSDREALAAIFKQARDAQAAGKTKEEVSAILAQGAPIRARLETAEKKLRADVMAVLTAEQRAWVESHTPSHCIDSLTAEQKTQISGLIATFEQSNRADLDAVKAAFEAARTAQHNGATQEQIRAILQTAKPAMERLQRAQLQLAISIAALLTPEQLRSTCHPTIGRSSI